MTPTPRGGDRRGWFRRRRPAPAVGITAAERKAQRMREEHRAQATPASDRLGAFRRRGDRRTDPPGSIRHSGGLLVLVATVAACGSGQVERSGAPQTGYITGTGAVETIQPIDRRLAPNLTRTTLDGSTYTLAGDLGQIVVINVWGSWCAPCRKEAPALRRLSEELAPRGVQFIGINTRDTAAGAMTFVKEFGISYPSVIDTDGRLLLAFRSNLPPAAIPSTLIIDREGRTAARVIGGISELSLRDLIRQIADET
jgi:thiol-disulfide isomerase/thioredoxin